MAASVAHGGPAARRDERQIAATAAFAARPSPCGSSPLASDPRGEHGEHAARKGLASHAGHAGHGERSALPRVRRLPLRAATAATGDSHSAPSLSHQPPQPQPSQGAPGAVNQRRGSGATASSGRSGEATRRRRLPQAPNTPSPLKQAQLQQEALDLAAAGRARPKRLARGSPGGASLGSPRRTLPKAPTGSPLRPVRASFPAASPLATASPASMAGVEQGAAQGAPAAAPACRRLQVRPAGVATPVKVQRPSSHAGSSEGEADAHSPGENNRAGGAADSSRPASQHSASMAGASYPLRRVHVSTQDGGAARPASRQQGAAPSPAASAPGPAAETLPHMAAAAARRPVLEEMVQTEETFVEALETLVLVFHIPLVADRVISVSDANALFTTQLNVLVNSHKQLLGALRADMDAVSRGAGDLAGARGQWGVCVFCPPPSLCHPWPRPSDLAALHTCPALT